MSLGVDSSARSVQGDDDVAARSSSIKQVRVLATLLYVRCSGRLPIRYMIMDFEAGIDTSAHAVGRARKSGNFVPSLCALPARACRASLSADSETEQAGLTRPT